jgi:hypothetical protein
MEECKLCTRRDETRSLTSKVPLSIEEQTNAHELYYRPLLGLS